MQTSVGVATVINIGYYTAAKLTETAAPSTVILKRNKILIKTDVASLSCTKTEKQWVLQTVWGLSGSGVYQNWARGTIKKRNCTQYCLDTLCYHRIQCPKFILNAYSETSICVKFLRDRIVFHTQYNNTNSSWVCTFPVSTWTCITFSNTNMKSAPKH